MFGAVDILINNAVVRHIGSIEAFGTAEWNEVDRGEPVRGVSHDPV